MHADTDGIAAFGPFTWMRHLVQCTKINNFQTIFYPETWLSPLSHHELVVSVRLLFGSLVFLLRQRQFFVLDARSMAYRCFLIGLDVHVQRRVIPHSEL